jgi:3-oxoacyl-[acyl-carrier protein] reductase
METAQTVQKAFDLTGRVAIVTGAGSGIGRASVEALAGAHATVICADRNGDSAEETAAGIRGANGTATAVALDVSASSEVQALVDQVIADHGRLDVMANIAGIMHEAQIADLPEDMLDELLAVNLKGVLFGCQAAARVMIPQGSGTIINMASAAVLTPSPDVGPYAITKAGVWQLTKSMAVEVGRKGVRVNAIAPGFVPTNMTARYYRRPDGTVDEDMKAAVLGPMARFAPLRRVGEPSDIAYCVLYLASDASSFLTGQLLSPNGGLAMH